MRRLLVIASILALTAAACADEAVEPVAAGNATSVGDPFSTTGAPAEESPGADAEDADDGGLADEAENGDGVITLDDGDRVRITMGEFSYDPRAFEVAKGSTVTFVFRSEGLVPHEAFFGDAHMQDEHEQEMLEGMGHDDGGHHGDEVMLALDAGEHGKVRYHFGERGEVLIGCHIPGHYDAGMMATVNVT